MLIVIIGGAGLLGSHSIPHLARSHQVRVLDQQPLDLPGVQCHRGDARSADDVAAAVAGADAVVHMAAAVPRRSAHDPAAVHAAFEVNVASIHLALTLAAAAGVRSFVHISTMSVFEGYRTELIDPAGVPDATHAYGLTKRLGEQVCAAMAPTLGVAAASLRLVYPTPDADWPLWRSPVDDRPPGRMQMADGRAIPGVAAVDVAAAIEAAAQYRGPYRPFLITADVEGVSVRPDDTPSVLGWSPTRVP